MRTRILFIALLGLAYATPLLTDQDIKQTLLTAITNQNINVEEIKQTLLTAITNQNINVEEIKQTLLTAITDQNINVEEIKQTLLTAEEGSRIGIVENIILQVLEQLRSLMVSGSENFPVLDPLVVDNINIDGAAINFPGSHVRIDDLVLRDLSTFEVENIEFRSVPILRYRLDFDVSIPSVNINTSSYDMFIRIFGGEVYGQGDMSLRIVKPRVTGYMVVGLRLTLNGTFLHIYDCRIGIGLDDFVPVINGMFNSEESSIFVSAFLRNLVRELLEFFENDITNIISAVVTFVGNAILSNFNIGDLLPLDAELKDFKSNV